METHSEAEELKYLDNFISEASDTITLKSALLEKNSSAIGKWPDDSFFAKKDSSLKKNTAFVKKVRNFLDSQKDALLAEFESLNLSKYVEEVATAIVEAKIKTTDIPFILKLCSAMHQRYSDFGSLFLDAWKKVLSTNKDLKHANLSKLRVDLALFADLNTIGVFREPESMRLLASQLTLLINGDLETFSNIGIICSFCRHCSDDWIGLIPRRVRVLSAKYNKSVPRSSFMPAERQAKCRALFHDYLEGARRFLQNMVKDAKKIVSANRNMMETRGEVSEDRQERADRLVSGCRKFHESLTTLADLLDVDPPSEFSCMLKEALKADDVDAVEPDENDTQIGVQLFEDEDTRLFYESLPDIKAMVPGILYKDSEQAKSESSRDKSEDEGGNLEDIDVEALESELAREEEEVSKNSEDSTSAINVTDRDKPPTMLGIDETEEDPNSSGKILMETFLTQLPNCVNRDLIDRAAVNFCLTLNKRSNRRRLARALLMVPRTRYDLLPFYARLVAALAPVMPDLVQDVNTMLTGEFQWRVSKRDQLNLESKLKIVRFIGELVKFRIYPAHQALACLKKLLPQFVHHNIEMACALLDTCGRFLYRSSSSHLRTKVYLEVMLRKKKALHMDQRYTIMIENTYYYCNPPSTSRQLVPTVVLTPTMQFLRRLLWRDLDRTTVNSVLRLIRKIDWNDTELVQFTEVLFTRAWEVRYTNINCLASILSGLAVFHRSFAMAVVDNVIEDVRVGMELNLPHLNQRRISMVKYLGLLYNYCLVDSPVIFKTLYSLLTFGVSLDSNVFSILDPPDSLFRITLICTLLETSGGFFDLGKKRRKLNIFLAYFQRYYWFKRSQPIWEQPQTTGSVRSESADPIPPRSTANQTSTNATVNDTQNTAGDLTQKSDEQTASVENGTDAPGSVTQSDKLPVFTPVPFPSGVEQMYAETLAQLRIKVFRATNLSQAVRLVNQLETRYLPRLARLKATYGLVDDGDAMNTAENELRNQTPRATCPGRMDPIAEESEQNEEIQMDDEDYVVDDDDDDDDDEDDDEDDDAEREEGRGRRNWRRVQTDQPEPDGIRRRGSQQEQKSAIASRTDQLAEGDTKLKPSTSDEDQTEEPFEDEDELAVRMGLKPRYIDCPEDAEFREALDRMTAEALLSTGPASGPGVGGSSGAVTGTPDGGPLRQSTASALPAPDILQLSATRTRPLGTQSSTPSVASTGKPSATIPEHTISLFSTVQTKPDESCLFIEAQDESQPTLDSDDAQNTVVFSLITRRGNRPHMVPLAVPETVQFAARFMQAEAAEREEKARMKQLVLEMHEAQKEEEMEWGHFGSQDAVLAHQFPVNDNRDRWVRYNHPKGAPDADAVFGTSRFHSALNGTIYSVVVQSLMLAGEVLTIVDCFSYLFSSVTTDGSTVVEVSTRISEARGAYAGLKYLRCRPDISLELKGRVYCATKLKPSTSDEDQTEEPFEDEDELAVRMGLKPRYIDCPEDAEFREALDRMTAEALLSTGPASGPGVGGSSGAVTGTPDGGPLRQSTASALPAPDILQLSATRTRPLGTQSSTPSVASTGKPSATIPEHTISLFSTVQTKPDESCLFIEAQDESQPTLDSDDAQNTVVFSLITRRGNRPHMVPLAVPETVQFAARFMQAEAAEREEKARMKQLVLEMHEAQKEEEMEWGHFGSQDAVLAHQFPVNDNRDRWVRYNHPKGAPDADAVFGTSSQRR